MLDFKWSKLNRKCEIIYNTNKLPFLYLQNFSCDQKYYLHVCNIFDQWLFFYYYYKKNCDIYFSEPPSELNNCTVLYQTDTALGIACNYTDEDETELKNEFLMVIRSGSEFINVTSDVPDFEVSGLKPDSEYDIALFVVNEAGKSRPIWMEIRTYPSPDRENRKGNVENINISLRIIIFIQ